MFMVGWKELRQHYEPDAYLSIDTSAIDYWVAHNYECKCGAIIADNVDLCIGCGNRRAIEIPKEDGWKCHNPECGRTNFTSKCECGLKNPSWVDKSKTSTISRLEVPEIYVELHSGLCDHEREIKECIEEAISIPGFIGQCIEYNLKTATIQQKPFALAGALSLTGILCGRKIRTHTDARTNIYLVVAANPGMGKDWARKVNERVLIEGGASYLLCAEEMTSDAALAASLNIHPARLFQADEIGRWLQTANAESSPHHHALVSLLLKLYSSVTSNAFMPKAYADPKRNLLIDQPHLVLLGTSTPDELYRGLGAESTRNGLLSRLAIFIEDTNAKPQDAQQIDPPQALVEFVRYWTDESKWPTTPPPGPKGQGVNMKTPAPQQAIVSDEVENLFKQFQLWCWETETAAKSIKGLWIRSAQKAQQYALCVAASQALYHGKVEITREAAEWGIKLSRALTMQSIRIAGENIAGSKFEALCQDHWRYLRSVGSATMTKLSRELRKYSSHERSMALEQLIDEGKIEKLVVNRSVVIQVRKS